MATSTIINTNFELKNDINTINGNISTINSDISTLQSESAKAFRVNMTSASTYTYTFDTNRTFIVLIGKINASSTSTSELGLYIGQAYSSGGTIYPIKSSGNATVSISKRVLSITTTTTNIAVTILYAQKDITP